MGVMLLLIVSPQVPEPDAGGGARRRRRRVRGPWQHGLEFVPIGTNSSPCWGGARRAAEAVRYQRKAKQARPSRAQSPPTHPCAVHLHLLVLSNLMFRIRCALLLSMARSSSGWLRASASRRLTVPRGLPAVPRRHAAGMGEGTRRRRPADGSDAWLLPVLRRGVPPDAVRLPEHRRQVKTKTAEDSVFSCVLRSAAFCVREPAFCVQFLAFCVQLRSRSAAFCVQDPAFCVQILRSAFTCVLRSAACVLRSDDVSLLAKEHPLKWAKPPKVQSGALRSIPSVWRFCAWRNSTQHSLSAIYHFPDSSRHPLPACAVCSPKQRGNGPHRAAPAVRLAFSVLRSGTCVLRAGTCVLRSDPAFCVQLRSAFSCVQNPVFSCVLRSAAFCVQDSAFCVQDPAFCVQLRSRSPAFCVQEPAFCV
eukprot:gene15681-biopygen7942